MGLEQIRGHWEKTEVEHDPARKYQLLEQALAATDDYLIEHEGSAEGARAENLRRAHARRLLVQLSAMDANDIEIEAWLDYFLVFVRQLQPDLAELTASDVGLKQAYRNFLDTYRAPLIDAAAELGLLGSLGGKK